MTGHVARLLWLVVVPTALAAASWIVWFGSYGPESTTSLVLILTPLVGLVPGLVYAGITRKWTALGPNLPFAIAAIAFAINLLQVRDVCAADPDCNPIPVVAFFAGMFLPFLALGGGLTSWIGPAKVHRWLTSIPRGGI